MLPEPSLSNFANAARAAASSSDVVVVVASSTTVFVVVVVVVVVIVIVFVVRFVTAAVGGAGGASDAMIVLNSMASEYENYETKKELVNLQMFKRKQDIYQHHYWIDINANRLNKLI